MSSAPDQTACTTPGRATTIMLAGCAALLGVLVYVNALDNPFVYDDYRLIVENTPLQTFANLQAILVRDITRPLVTLSYAIDTAIWGRIPFGYHLTSVLLHGVNVVLVFYVALVASEDSKRRNRSLNAAGVSSVVAMSTALLFAVHPMMTQAVGYISGRSEVAYGCLFMLAFLAGRRWMLRGGWSSWILTVGLWIGAMLAKESAVMLPVVLIAYDWFVLETKAEERRRRFVWLGVPTMVLAVAVGVWRLALLQLSEYDGPSGDWRFALVAVDAFWRTVGLFAIPRDQAIFHALPMLSSPIEPRALADLAGLGALVAVIWRLRRRHGAIAFGLSWFILIMIPSSALFASGIGEPLAEHRAYVAAAGLFLATGCVFGVFWDRVPAGLTQRGLVGGVALLFVAGLAMQAVARNVVWGDPVELSREAARLAPDHWVPRLLLAEAYRHAGLCADAIPEYQAAVAFNPRDEFAYPKLAGCLLDERRPEEAQRALLDLKKVNPTSRDASLGLGLLAALGNRVDESRAHFREAVAGDSQQARALLAFVEGTLPAGDHLRLCQQLHDVSDTFDFDACTQWSQAHRK